MQRTMSKLPTSFLTALIASGCTFVLSLSPVVIDASLETPEGSEQSFTPERISPWHLAAGMGLSLVAGGTTLAFLESRRHHHASHHLHQKLNQLESTLEEKNEKLVALALQAGSLGALEAMAEPVEAPVEITNTLPSPAVVTEPVASAPDAAPIAPTEDAEPMKDPAAQLQELLAWTSAVPATPSVTEQPTTEAPTEAMPAVVETPTLIPSPAPLPPQAIQAPAAPQPTPTVSQPAVASSTSGIPTLPPVAEVDPMAYSGQETRGWQLQLMLQHARLEELETLAKTAQERESLLQEQLMASQKREKALRDQLEAQSERLMTLEAYQAQVQQQQEQLRQLHAALHKMKQHIAQKNEQLTRYHDQQHQVEHLQASLKGYQSTIQQNQELKLALHTLQSNLPSAEEMDKIYQLVQRQRQRIQDLEETVQSFRKRSIPLSPLSQARSADVLSFPPQWRELIREADLTER
ncbi:MAG: hypothetical protein OHK0012_13850 [Synechococcales cyanobacterium]